MIYANEDVSHSGDSSALLQLKAGDKSVNSFHSFNSVLYIVSYKNSD